MRRLQQKLFQYINGITDFNHIDSLEVILLSNFARITYGGANIRQKYEYLLNLYHFINYDKICKSLKYDIFKNKNHQN